MSSFNILGFFQLKSGRRVSLQKTDSTYLTYHAHYNTNVWCINNTCIPADLRMYTTSTTPLLPDGTVAFAVCTAHSTATTSPPANNLLLEVITFIVLPGDPSSSTYNDQLPDERTSLAYGVGRVSGNHQILDDGHSSRIITVGVSDYVRGDTKASTINCIFDLSTNRWTRAPTPQANTVIQFYGLCRDLSPAGILRVKLESIALNIASTTSAPSSSSATSSGPITPSKRRKFSPSPDPPSAAVENPITPSHSLSKSAIASPGHTDTSLINNPMPHATVPTHYGQLFQQYPHNPSLFPSHIPQPFFAHHNPYSMPGYAGFVNPPFVAPSFNPAEHTSSTSGENRPPSTVHVTSPLPPANTRIPIQTDNDSAFNRSAADPYSYPMTQATYPASSSALRSINTPSAVQQQSSSSTTISTDRNPQSNSQTSPAAASTSSVPLQLGLAAGLELRPVYTEPRGANVCASTPKIRRTKNLGNVQLDTANSLPSLALSMKQQFSQSGSSPLLLPVPRTF
ncbi:hypothetical protein C8R44DRAFT_749085 [Mycena epipterygia]|nr:hypothetical protein C8R44DRAFT_749085 [Mycena epipterygia]